MDGLEGLFSTKKGFLILLLNSYLVQLSKTVILPTIMEENYIPLETQSQADKEVTPSKPEGSKLKGKRHSEGLITANNWTPISTQMNRKPRNAASIQGKITLTTCTGKITIINLVVTSKGKLPKAVGTKFVQGTFKGTSQRIEKAFPEPQDLEEDTLDTVADGKTLREVIQTLTFTLQFNRNLKPEGWKDMDQVLQLPNPQGPFSMEHGQQDVKPSIPLGTTWGNFPQDMSQRDRIQRPYGNHQRLESHQKVQTPGSEKKWDKGESSHYPSYRRTTDPDREYSDSFTLTISRPNQLSSDFKPFGNQHISGQESPLFTIPGRFQEKTRTQGQKQDLL
ncbi:hypothetical protein O181_103604 [Austropuccinia psidii MF-1]|uniref:Uncharacterized protein n=1 Tax=Austropuccinia psidii MF-1 TaxID=1389203 RepID=A0A9Q3JLJ2_9BASI|nr:hypothetical protein [Austropuccinia psidii MF-1]